MPKINLQNSFKEFCEQNKFEINAQQTEIINLLDFFLNEKKTFLSKVFTTPLNSSVLSCFVKLKFSSF